MSVDQKIIEKAERFLKDQFNNSSYMSKRPTDREYRLQHSYRVANIGKMIAEKEGFDVTEMTIACLFHDIAYCEGFQSEEDWLNHGRNSARIAKPFFESLGIGKERIHDICYGIAIHVDDGADFDGVHTAFAKSVGDADNIDRYDVYRIYEGLQYMKFNEISFMDKMQKVDSILNKSRENLNMELGTNTATEMWKQRIEFKISFYERLKEQLSNSNSIT